MLDPLGASMRLSRHTALRLSLILVATLLAAPSCRDRRKAASPNGETVVSPTQTAGATEGASVVTEPSLDGLRIRLSRVDSSVGTEEREEREAATTTPLDAAATKALLARMPTWSDTESERRAFAWRPKSEPPPRTAATVATSFPASVGPGIPEASGTTLGIVRWAPEGDVHLAPHVTVSFNQPMVSLSSQDEAAERIPVAITPTVDGAWRWLGTKTLIFEPSTRFPMATNYTVTTQAGARSMVAGALAEEHVFRFRTPPVRLVRTHPQSGPPTQLEPVLFLGFDQSIDREAIMDHLRLRHASKEFPVRMATDEEVEADPEVRSLTLGSPPDRWVAVVPKAPLPRDTEVQVELREGAPSAEGPRTTDQTQSFSFRTFGPLKVTESECGWSNTCSPQDTWRIQFSNPLDVTPQEAQTWTVTPDVRANEVEVRRSTVMLKSIKKGQTTYTIRIPGSTKDMFGQTLGRDEEITFKVGSSKSMMAGPGRSFIVLDPEAPPSVSLYTINHSIAKLRVFKASSEDWHPLAQWMQQPQERQTSPPPLTRLATTTVPIESAADDLTETSVDLSPWLAEESSLFLWFEPSTQPKNSWERRDVFVWIQRSTTGLTAFADQTELLGWATDLSSGRPSPGLELTILDAGGKTETSPARTDETGTARIPLPAAGVGPQVLVARRDGQEVAFLPRQTGWWRSGPGWIQSKPEDELRWFVYDDRGLYRPGEEVALKGFIRRVDVRKGGDISMSDTTRIAWTLKGPQWNEIGSGEGTVDAWGGFALRIPLPPTMNLGTARLQLSSIDGSEKGRRTHNHPFKVAEFRRPEFEVKTSVDPGPYVLGDHALVEVSAKYFSGGGLRGAKSLWTVTTAPGRYQPPGWEDWSFGAWSPWWRSVEGNNRAGSADAEVRNGVTDGLGTDRLRIQFEAMSPPRPWVVQAEATVWDVNRQAWTSTSKLLVHPAAHYPAVKLEKGFVAQGEKITAFVAAAGIDGEAIGSHPVDVVAERMTWEYSQGTWSETVQEQEACTVKSTDEQDEPATCSFTPHAGGSWRISATTTDSEGRKASTEVRVWVRGGKGKPNRNLIEEALTLIPNNKEYKVGETASVLVQAPFSPWEGLATYQRSGIVKSIRFRAEGPTHVIEIPIEETYLPGLLLRVDATGQTPRLDTQGSPATDQPKRPAFATGEVRLSIPPALRTLKVHVDPRQSTLPPGGETTLDLAVRGADGEPVGNAEFAVVVVDESVLSLTNYDLPDPMSMFYEARPGGVKAHKLRRSVVLADAATLPTGDRTEGDRQPEMERKMETAMSRAAPADDHKMMMTPSAMTEEASEDALSSEAVVQPRTNFDALALFAPAVISDDEGKASIPITLPDSITRYRVMVVAVDQGTRFGKGETSVTARKPLMVRPSPPRFLNFGDTFELPFVLQNQTTEPLEVDVALRTANLRLQGGAFPSGSAVRVTVPAEDRAEVRFPASSDNAGTARFQVIVAATTLDGPVSDAAEQEFPVWTPATSEVFATYGVIDSGAIAQPIRAPDDVWSQFGGLEVTTSSTALQALTDAMVYLANYRYECAEQLSSRVLGIAALRDVLTAFESEQLPSPKELEALVERDIDVLRQRQNSDGGFGFWRRGQQSWPWVSVHAAHALARAETKGYGVPADVRQGAIRYLREIDTHIPSWYSLRSRRAVVAYAVFVRELYDDKPAKRARELFKEADVDGLSIESLGFLLPVLDAAGDGSSVDAITQHLLNRVSETAGAAHFVESYTDGAHVLMHSNRRSDGVILEALTRVRPENDLIPKVVEGLLGARSQGHWLNTQENVFVLLALDRYFNTYEETTPDFVARIWLGNEYAGEHSFQGRTTDRALTSIPMGALTAGEETLTLQKDGGGRLYYRIGMSYAPRSLELEPADRGFAVERRYEAVDDPADVSRDQDGTWHIAAGARVRVRLTMVATGNRSHVALVDPLPAGLEPVNPALATSGSPPPDESDISDDPHTQRGYWWWWRPWYEHENLRDDRVEAFSNLLWAGVHTYNYIARATTPGTFVAPPTKAEEMYNPETFGRSGTDRVVVK